jgi:hypothetical protein
VALGDRTPNGLPAPDFIVALSEGLPGLLAKNSRMVTVERLILPFRPWQ